MIHPEAGTIIPGDDIPVGSDLEARVQIIALTERGRQFHGGIKGLGGELAAPIGVAHLDGDGVVIGARYSGSGKGAEEALGKGAVVDGTTVMAHLILGNTADNLTRNPDDIMGAYEPPLSPTAFLRGKAIPQQLLLFAILEVIPYLCSGLTRFFCPVHHQRHYIPEPRPRP